MTEREGARLLPNMENHRCFGCGPANAHGLRMQFYGDGDSVCSWVKVPSHLCGWDNLVHGGVLSTILDEIMGRAIIYLLQSLGLTRNMSIDFLKPVFIGREIQVRGRILDVTNGREARVEGTIANGNGELCARATGTFILFPPEKIRKLGIVADDVLDWFERTIRKT
jgi:uncharacterized protein (TIGR00369 family)